MAAETVGRGKLHLWFISLPGFKTHLLTEAWKINASEFSKRVHNPIRAIVDNIKKPNDPEKELIPLSLGKCGISLPSRGSRHSLQATPPFLAT